MRGLLFYTSISKLDFRTPNEVFLTFTCTYWLNLLRFNIKTSTKNISFAHFA